MKILVTGGAGFIASHIVDAYLEAGHEVAVIDNLSTGFEKNLNNGAKFYNVDIRDKTAVEKVFAEFKPELVNHHAALASVVDSAKGAIETYEINVMGTINLLECMSGVSRFIFASTGGAMYGLDAKLADESRPDPISNYGVSKLLGEQLIQFYSREKNFDFVILRYSNVFGPRQNPRGEAGVVAIFSLLMSQGKAPTVYNAQATRDYVYVDDVVRANVGGLEKGAGEIMNIGRGVEVSNDVVFETVARACGFADTPSYAEARPGEVLHVSLDASRAREVLGWQPTIEFVDGVMEVKEADYAD